MRIDWWTLALQTVNVLILVWILARFFFRPVAEIVAKRQEVSRRLLADAEAARDAAAAQRTETERAHADIAAGRDRMMAQAREAAEAEKASLLAQSADEIAKLRHDAKAAIAGEQAAADRAVVAHATELSIDIARRLLARLPPGLSFAAFLDGACRELRLLPPEDRESFVAAPIEVVTAAPLSDAQANEVRGALGGDADLVFASDPALIAGIELRGRNTIVRNSWQADLERIREELSHDGHDGRA